MQVETKTFADKYGMLTVGDALELNRIAKETCEWETTACTN